ncbi:chorismate-binding protein [Sorangium atrum]|uniref:aminodeoxychorismate synthase n=1 Tax=Sorangium atrum TaxID=2995308 RepID=A0ABT5BTZ4_9BACT|nr:chorismate-binding protein [Sorangium aterium]MDC0677193.1 chorismate-binding protein [Sorangium aterium]
MKTLLIDNYDSYTHILGQYLWEASGEEPIIVRNDSLSLAEIEGLELDGIVISPGPGRPERRADFGVCAEVIEALAGTPILGVCLGHQGLAARFGGRVQHAPRVMHGKIVEIEHDGAGLFEGVPSPFQAVRYHSLIVGDGGLPAEIQVTARTRGDRLIMALKIKDRPFYGVQFHPESIGTEHGRRIIRNFRDIALNTPRDRRRAALHRSARAPGLSAGALGGCAPGAPAGARRRGRVRHLRLPWVDPERAFAGLFAAAPYAFWLDSSATGRDGRFSFMGSATEAIESRGAAVTRWSAGGPGDALTSTTSEGSPFAALRRELASVSLDPSGLPFHFTGGLVGYLGYELKEHLGFGASAHPRRALPDSAMMIARRILAFDHVERAVYACAIDAVDAIDAIDGDEPARPAPPSSAPWLDEIAARLHDLPALSEPLLPPVPEGFADRLTHAPRLSRREHLEAIEAILREIREGETYEVCLTNEFLVPTSLDPFALYRVLRRTNPAQFSAFLKLPEGAVLSSSPERFLSVDRERRVRSEPIKGTRPKGATEEETLALRRDLASSDKDRSELLMITDLVRNDLSRVCAMGSIDVEALQRITEHATLLQLSSVVTGALREGKGALDAIEACFPGGSITGAPKHRTISIIDALERRTRGVYTGSIGYLAYEGPMDMNIAIRTLVADGRGLSFGSGGAVVAESSAEAEYEEVLVKSFPLLRAIYLAERAADGGRASAQEVRATSAHRG